MTQVPLESQICSRVNPALAAYPAPATVGLFHSGEEARKELLVRHAAFCKRQVKLKKTAEAVKEEKAAKVAAEEGIFPEVAELVRKYESACEEYPLPGREPGPLHSGSSLTGDCRDMRRKQRSSGRFRPDRDTGSRSSENHPVRKFAKLIRTHTATDDSYSGGNSNRELRIRFDSGSVSCTVQQPGETISEIRSEWEGECRTTDAILFNRASSMFNGTGPKDPSLLGGYSLQRSGGSESPGRGDSGCFTFKRAEFPLLHKQKRNKAHIKAHDDKSSCTSMHGAPNCWSAPGAGRASCGSVTAPSVVEDFFRKKKRHKKKYAFIQSRAPHAFLRSRHIGNSDRVWDDDAARCGVFPISESDEEVDEPSEIARTPPSFVQGPPDVGGVFPDQAEKAARRSAYRRRKWGHVKPQMSVEGDRLDAGDSTGIPTEIAVGGKSFINLGDGSLRQRAYETLMSAGSALGFGCSDEHSQFSRWSVCTEGPTEVIASTKAVVETRHVVLEAVNRLAAVLVIISQADTFQDLLINFTASVALMVNRETFAAIENFLGSKHVTPQADSSVRDWLLSMKTGLLDPETIPAYSVVKKCFMVATLLGLRSGDEIQQKGLLYDAFRAWDKQAVKMSRFNLVDCAIDIALFVHEMVVLLERGAPLTSVLMPRTIASRLCEYEALLSKFKAGNINPKEDNMTMEEYKVAVTTLKHEASATLAQSSGGSFSEKEAAQRVYAHVCVLHSTIKMCGMTMEPKEAAFGLMFYGQTSVGKSTAMNVAASYFGSVGGFPADPERNHFNVSDADNFDSGLTKLTNILVFDDAGNSKEVHIMIKAIEMMSNVAKYSNQADLDLKGMIPYKFDLGVGSTNHWDGDISRVTTAPLSLLRRFVWLETSCPSNANGRFDSENVWDSEGNYNDQHVVREYEFFADNTTSMNYKRRYITEPMPLLQWLEEHGRGKLLKWREGQKTFKKTMSRMSDFKQCTHGRIKARCFMCKEIAVEEQYQVVIPAWLSNLCHAYANVTAPLIDPLFDAAPRLVSKLMADQIWKTAMCVVGRNWLNFAIRISPILIAYHYALVVLYSDDIPYRKYQIAGLIVLFVYFAWAARRACRSHVAYCIERNLRGSRGVFATLIVGQLGFFYVFARRLLNNTLVTQQSLAPTPEAQEERSKETSMWCTLVEKPPSVQVSGKVRTMTEDQVLSVVAKCVGRLSYLEGCLKISTSYTRISTREVVVPAHFATRLEEFDSDVVLTVQRSVAGSTMIPYKAVIESFRYHEVADLCILVLSEGPPGPNLRDLIYGKMPTRSVAATLVRCDADGEKTYTVYADCLPICTTSDTNKNTPAAPAVQYTFVGNQRTQAGDCGSPLINKDFPHVILGFHVGGGLTTGVAHVANLEGFNSSKQAMYGRVSHQSFEPLPIADDMPGEDIHGIGILPPESDPGERNPMRFIPLEAESPHTYLAGTVDPPRAPKSEVRTTLVSEALEDQGLPCKFEKPKINANRNGAAYIHYALSPMSPISPSLVRRVVNEYVGHAVSEMGNYRPGPLYRSIEEALNGIPGDRFSKPMRLNTAAGVYMPGKKSKYVTITEFPDSTRVIEPTALLRKRVEDMEHRYIRGLQCSPLTRAACKDEPVMKEEYAGKKKIVRQFMVCPFEFLIVGRMLLAELVRTMILHPFIFGMVQGCNVYTSDWTELQEYFLGDFTQILEGDYSKYDVRMNGQMIRAAGAVFARLADHFDAKAWHVRAIRTYFEDLTAKHISIAGVLLAISGWNVSGHGVTIEANGIVNKLLYMCAYYYTVESQQMVHPPKYDSVVKIMFMGDDSVGRSSVPWFNMRSMQVFCEDHNLPYTAGDKSAISADQPFLRDGASATFCKRKWRWVERRKRYDCPLDLDSIMRPFHVRMRNAEISDQQYLKDQIYPLLLELGRHPQEVFDEYIVRVARAFLACGMWFDDLERSYSEVQKLIDSYYSEADQETFGHIPPTVSPVLEFAPLTSIPEMDIEEQMKVSLITLPLLADASSCSAWEETQRSVARFTSSSLGKVFEASVERGHGGLPVPPVNQEFGFEPDDIRIGPASNINNNSFLVHDSEHLGHGMASLGLGTAVQGSDSLDNNEVLSREVKIATFEWRNGADEFFQFNPWSLLFEDRVMANRLAHFRLLHCMGLELRFTMSGSPMMFGRLLCSYTPLHTVDNTTLHRADIFQDMLEATQRPHIIMNPALSDGGTLTVPYNYPVPFFDIAQRDWSNAGLITMQTINRLAHATGQTGSAYINVFVRAIAPSVSVGTSQLSVIQPQMDRVTDAAIGDMKEMVQPLALRRSKAVTVGPEDVRLNSLAYRKSLLTSFQWATSDSPGTHLFSTEVCPQLYNRVNDEVHMIPACWTTNPFEYWRSDMEFVFEIVCSGLHRGKLVIRWDPLGFDDSKREDFHLTRALEIDLKDSSTQPFRVGWGSPFPYLQTASRDVFDTPCFQTAASMIPRPHTNGTVSVYVLNGLTIPNEEGPPQVSVNVYAGAGSGYEILSLTPRTLRCLKTTESSNDDGNPQDSTNDAPDGGHTDITLPPSDPLPPPGDTGIPKLKVQTRNLVPDFGPIFRSGFIRPPNLASFSNEFPSRDTPQSNTGTVHFFYDGAKNPRVSVEFDLNANNPVNLTFSGGGSLTLDPSQTQTIVVRDLPLTRPDGPPGWYSETYTASSSSGTYTIIWRKCVLIGLSVTSGIAFIGDQTSPTFREDLGQGFTGRNFSAPTQFTLGNKVVRTPVVFVMRSGATVGYSDYDGVFKTYTASRDESVVLPLAGAAPNLNGAFISIAYVFDLAPQSDEAIAPSEETEVEATQQTGGPDLGQPVLPPSEMQIAADEIIPDWYAVLNRFTASYALTGNSTSISAFLPHYPVEHFSSPEANSTYIRNGLFEYISRAYLGVRGSMNMKISRDPRGFGELRHRTFTIDRLPTTQQIVGFEGDTKVVSPFLLSGTAWSNDLIQAGMDVNIPHYSNYRYYPARSAGLRGLTPTHAPSNCWFRGWLSATEGLIVSYSRGHDFSLESFVSTPVMIPCSSTSTLPLT